MIGLVFVSYVEIPLKVVSVSAACLRKSESAFQKDTLTQSCYPSHRKVRRLVL